MSNQALFNEAFGVLNDWLQSIPYEGRQNLHKHLAAGSQIVLEIRANPEPFDRARGLSVVLVHADGNRQTLSAGVIDEELH